MEKLNKVLSLLVESAGNTEDPIGSMQQRAVDLAEDANASDTAWHLLNACQQVTERLTPAERERLLARTRSAKPGHAAAARQAAQRRVHAQAATGIPEKAHTGKISTKNVRAVG